MEFKNLLFIDNTVRDYQIFVDSVNEQTCPIIYSPTEPGYEVPGLVSVERIGIVFTNVPDPMFLGSSFFESILPDLIRTYQVKTIDFLACSTLLDPRWVDYYLWLEKETGVLVGASNDLTGNIKYGGDWVMESTSQDIEFTYFTKTIEYYSYLLDLAISSVVLINGILWGVGNNSSGQLGIGDNIIRSVFTNITEKQTQDFQSRTVKSISLNSNLTTNSGHTIILMEDGTVWGAGSNAQFQLGSVSLPTNQFQRLTGYTGVPYKIATGPTHTMIATLNNTNYELWATGTTNSYGPEGLFNRAFNSQVFLKITAVTLPIVSMISNLRHTAILFSDSIYTIGVNTSGQLGTGSTSPSANVTTALAMTTTIVDATNFCTMFISNGSVFSAGGPPFNASSVQTNSFVRCATNASVLSGGLEHMLLLKNDNTLWGCGRNDAGQLGINPGKEFTQIPFTHGTIQTIQAGYKQSIVITTENRLFVTGNNIYSQLGTNNTTNITQLQEVFLPILFTPATGTTNTPITVTGVNIQNFSSVIIQGRNVSSIVYSNSLMFKAPASSGNVSITIQYKQGQRVASSNLFTYENPTSTISVNYGTTNTPVTLNGSFLNNTSSILFGTLNVSFNGLSVYAPPGSGNVSVFWQDQLQNSIFSGIFTYQNPSVLSTSILKGANQSPITLNGSFLSNTSRVLFDTVDVSFETISGTIYTKAPNGSGNASITLVDSLENTTFAGSFEYQNPRVTSLSVSYGPNKAPVGINGSFLSNTSRVLFGSLYASFETISGTVYAKAPDSSGNVSITLVDSLKNTTFAGTYEYQNPIVSTISVSYGPNRTPVAVNGSYLANTSRVLFGLSDASFVTVSGVVYATVPDGSGNVAITLIDAFQNESDAKVFEYRNPKEMITSELFGTTSKQVLVYGTNLENTSRVLFGETDASFVPLYDSVTITTPPGSGNVSVVLVDSLLNNTYIGKFQYLNPYVSSISVSYGPNNRPITINGSYFQDIQRILFGEQELFVIPSTNQLNIRVPPGTGNVSIWMKDSFENKTFVSNFEYQNIKVSELSPSYGTTQTPVTINGSYLANTSKVLFSGKDASFVTVSGIIYAKAPPGYGNANVLLKDFLQNTTVAGSFEYHNMLVSSISASFGTAQKQIYINGSYLENTSKVLFGSEEASFDIILGRLYANAPVGEGNVSIMLEDSLKNTIFAGNYEYRNPITQISASSGPVGEPLQISGLYLENTSRVLVGGLDVSFSTVEGVIQVAVPPGQGVVAVQVVDNLGNVTTVSQYTYQIPNVSYIVARASQYNTSLTIYGDYLDTLTQIAVQEVYGNVMGESFPVTGTPIELTVQNMTGNVSLSWVDARGNEGGYLFNINYLLPNVSWIEPGSGIPENIVTLHGGHLENTTYVTFGNLEAQLVDLTNASVRVIIPPGTENVSVQVLDTNGYTAKYQGRFTYEKPTITQISSEGAPSRSTISIYGTNLAYTTEVYFGQMSTRFIPNMSMIQASVPVDQGNVSIRVVDMYGYSATYPVFAYRNPGIVNVFPKVAPSNSVLTITGSYLSEIETIYFGSIPTTQFAAVSTSLYVTVPPYFGNVSISVRDNYGNLAYYLDSFTYDSYEITRVHPLKGIKDDYVEVECPNFDPIVSIQFGDTPVTKMIHLSDECFIVRVPECEESSRIVIRDAAGKSGVYPTPFVRTIPTIGSVNTSGQMVTVYGSGLSKTDCVVLDTMAGTDLYVSNVSLSFQLPPGSGNATLKVVDIHGNSINTSYTYAVDNPVVEGPIYIHDITPAGPELYRVSIRGENFLYASGVPRIKSVLIGVGAATDLKIVSSTLLYCTVPLGIGTQHVLIVDDQDQEVPNDLTYFYLVPQISDVSPNQGMENMLIFLYGSVLDQVKHVLIGDTLAQVHVLDNDCIQVTIPKGTGTHPISLVDLAYNIHLTPFEFTYADIQSRICFPAGTTVQTDQGLVEIQMLIPDTHTLDGKRIVAITKTYGMDDDLVCLKKGALRKNYPNKTTVMTRCHKIFMKGELISAQRLVDQYKGISLIPYKGERLYNVLLEEAGRMKVHGMWCETLDPINPIAKFFMR